MRVYLLPVRVDLAMLWLDFTAGVCGFRAVVGGFSADVGVFSTVMGGFSLVWLDLALCGWSLPLVCVDQKELRHSAMAAAGSSAKIN